jgi:hypothetical protein
MLRHCARAATMASNTLGYGLIGIKRTASLLLFGKKFDLLKKFKDF